MLHFRLVVFWRQGSVTWSAGSQLSAGTVRRRRWDAMVPRPGEYISLLMGAPTLTEAELRDVGVTILERFRPDLLGLLVGRDCIQRYKELVRERLEPGFWNDLVSPDEILFVFKLADGTVKEFTLSEQNREEISRICSELNGDPLEKTSDLPRYFAANPFYRDVMVACYGAQAE